MRKIVTPVLILSLLGGGCVNPNMARYQDSTLPVTPPSSISTVSPRPAGTPESGKQQDAYRETDSGKRYSLTLKDAELRDVLVLLSRESNVPIVADRDVEGRVTVNLANKKLGEILYTILKPLEMTARVENGIIIVGRPAMITRTYQINYLKDKRETASNTSSGGGVKIATSGSSDFWPAIESALEVLIFGTSGKGTRNGSGYIRGDVETREVSEKEGGVTVEAKGKGDRTSEPGRNDENLGKMTTSSGSLNLTGSGRSQATSYQRQDIKTKRQLIVNELAGIVQVTDYSDNIDKITSFLADIEPAIKRQVMIQAHIIEVSLSDGFSLGLNWRAIADKATNLSFSQALMPVTALTGTAANPVPVPLNQNAFNISGGNGDFSLLLDAMKEQGQIKILSSPKISALNNQKAVIKLTTQEVSWDFKTKDTSSGNTTNTNSGYESKIIEVGIFLDVTPQISEDGTITMQVHPSISEVKSVSVSPDNKSTMPIIDTREIDTTAIAKSGDTIVIAGLIVDKLRESKRSVPLLGDIPYAGALFSSSSTIRAKTELVIMLTPYVLNTKNLEEIRKEHEQRLQNISGDFHLINNLGSMVTEKNSRDWIMRSEPNRLKTEPSNPGATESMRAVPVTPSIGSPQNQESIPTLAPTMPKRPEIGVQALPQASPTVSKTDAPADSAIGTEKQMLEIKRLEQEVRISRELLESERRQNLKLAEEAKRPEIIKAAGAPRSVSPERAVTPGNPAFSASQPVAASLPALQPGSYPESVQTISVTSEQEQVLYRSAVTAYKTGDCKASISSFNRFLTLYPNSPFAQDAVYYRKDCTDRQ